MSKKILSNDYKSKKDFYADRPIVNTKSYSDYIKKKFSVANNKYYDSLNDAERETVRLSQRASGAGALTYDDYITNIHSYNTALKKLQSNKEFVNSPLDKQISMMLKENPNLEKILNKDKSGFNNMLTLDAYEDRERYIATGDYEFKKAQIYRENYIEAINDSNLVGMTEFIQKLKEVSDDDLIYFIEELLPPMPDWYGLNGSILVENNDFIQQLSKAFDNLAAQKGNN